MKNYLLNYDLRKFKNYPALYRFMARWNAVRLTESSWLIRLVGPAEVVRDLASAYIDNDDTLTVVELGADWATYNAPSAANAWLSANMFPAKKAA